MAIWNDRLRKFVIVASLACGSLAGCGKSPGRASLDARTDSVVPVPNPADAGTSDNSAMPAAINFNEPFNDAVITEVLEGHHLPPDVTLAGKKTGPLRAAIETSWPNIKLTDDENRPLARTLTIETDQGPFEITLRPELAPNHVRNMLALAALGYFDGLVFERNVHQETEGDGAKSRLDLLTAGCPLGTGDEGYGHLGYFVRAEFQPDLKHAEGTVGFWRERDPDSAGTRFYITLSPAPALDGEYTVVGQVSKGLDVLKRIAAQPAKSTDSSSDESEKPLHPTAIKKITISPDVLVK